MNRIHLSISLALVLLASTVSAQVSQKTLTLVNGAIVSTVAPSIVGTTTTLPRVNGSVLVYGPDGTQGTITGGATKLFDVKYGSVTGVKPVGAFIDASTSTGGLSATGLTVSANSGSGGTSIGLQLTTGGSGDFKDDIRGTSASWHISNAGALQVSSDTITGSSSLGTNIILAPGADHAIDYNAVVPTGDNGHALTLSAQKGDVDFDGGAVSITGAAGGDASATAGGHGGQASLTGGAGGAASGAMNSGTGGAVIVTGGAGGANTGSGSVGGNGNVSLSSGGGFISLDGGVKTHMTPINNGTGGGAPAYYFVDYGSTQAAATPDHTSNNSRATDAYIDIDASTGAGVNPITIYLPTADSAGRELTFAVNNQNATPNSITITPAGLNTIAGNSSLTLSSTNSYVKLMSNGQTGANGNWYLEASRGAASTTVAAGVAVTINDGHLQTSGSKVTLLRADYTTSDNTVFDVADHRFSSPDFSGLGGDNGHVVLVDDGSDITASDGVPASPFRIINTTNGGFSFIDVQGSGHSIGDTVGIGPGTSIGTGATATVTGIDGSGGITQVTVDITNSNHQYNTADETAAVASDAAGQAIDGLGPNSTDVAGSFSFTSGSGSQGTSTATNFKFVKLKFELPYTHAIVAISPGNAAASGSWGLFHLETDYKTFFKLVCNGTASSATTYTFNYTVVEAD